jgi:hypothetical protein
MEERAQERRRGQEERIEQSGENQSNSVCPEISSRKGKVSGKAGTRGKSTRKEQKRSLREEARKREEAKTKRESFSSGLLPSPIVAEPMWAYYKGREEGGEESKRRGKEIGSSG